MELSSIAYDKQTSFGEPALSNHKIIQEYYCEKAYSKQLSITITLKLSIDESSLIPQTKNKF